jgi:serine/threonine-protein kinase
MPEIGDVIGHVRLVARLGAGGMGEVWEGIDERLGRRVAVKAIRHATHADDLARARFAREARILSQLEHQNICRLYELVEDEAYDVLILELVSGRTLRRAIRDGMRPAERLDTALGIGAALVAAHALSIVHRDLKPENVMLSDDGAVKVLDFGIARRLAEDEALDAGGDALTAAPRAGATPADTAALTRAGEVVGTPHYMSPEHARGEPVTAASDMFAFGLLLHELFTGRAPYESTDPTTVLRRARWGDVPSPTGIDRHVAALIRDLTDLDARKRPSAAQACARLAHICQRPARRLRRAALAVAAAGLILGTALSLLGLKRARREAAAAEATTAFLVRLFDASNPEQAAAPGTTARELLDRGTERLRHDLAAQPQTKARLLTTLGGIYSNLGLHREAAGLLEEALRLAEGEAGPDAVVLIPTLLALADSTFKQGELDKAEKTLRRAAALATRRGEAADHARALTQLGALLGQAGRLDEAETTARQAVDLSEQAHGADHVDTAAALANLGMVLFDRGRAGEAEPILARSLAILERDLGGDHPNVARNVNALASANTALGNFAVAETLHRRALASFERRLGPEHPQVALVRNDLGVVLIELHRYAEAEAEYARSVSIAEKALGEEHPLTGVFRGNLGEAVLLQGRSAEAEPILQQAVAAVRDGFGDEHPFVAESLRILGLALAAQGRLQEAEETLLQSVRIREAALGPDHADLGRVLVQLGEFYLDRGRRDDAARALARAGTILPAALGPDHPHLARLRAAQARLAQTAAK